MRRKLLTDSCLFLLVDCTVLFLAFTNVINYVLRVFNYRQIKNRFLCSEYFHDSRLFERAQFDRKLTVRERPKRAYFCKAIKVSIDVRNFGR